MATNAPKIKPLADRIMVKTSEPETKTAGGIVLPDSAADKPMEGEVIAVGPGKSNEGKVVPLQVKPGDRILFGKYSGTEIKHNNEKYLIMREEDVLGIVA